METGFFSRLIALQAAGDWKLTISAEQEGRIVVAALLYNDSTGDNARKVIPPFLFRGTPQEIDNAFFETLAAPVQATSGLFTSMEQYLKAQEQARLQSQMERDKAAKAEKEKTERLKKYTEAMKKADELEAAGKYREAWMKVPEVADFPEQEEDIRKRKSALSAKFSPDLFQAPKNETPC